MRQKDEGERGLTLALSCRRTWGWMLPLTDLSAPGMQPSPHLSPDLSGFLPLVCSGLGVSTELCPSQLLGILHSLLWFPCHNSVSRTFMKLYLNCPSLRLSTVSCWDSDGYANSLENKTKQKNKEKS